MQQYPEMLDHYADADEEGRLTSPFGRLELLRTQRILLRLFPPAPAVVYDVGGAAGIHSLWLASLGYSCHLIDVVPKHIEQARAASQRSDHPLSSCTVGDGRSLDVPTGRADAVLLLGPLYHLPEQQDREACWLEAARILKPGGVAVGAIISRFASLLDGLGRGHLADPDFAAIVRDDLDTGRHRNPTDNPDYFTTAYFQRSDEAAAEAASAGFRVTNIVGVEGPAWLSPQLPQLLEDADRRELLLALLDRVESEPSLIGASAHALICATKP